VRNLQCGQKATASFGSHCKRISECQTPRVAFGVLRVPFHASIDSPEPIYSMAMVSRGMRAGWEEENDIMTEYRTDIEIARAANKKPIMEIGETLGHPADGPGSLRS